MKEGATASKAPSLEVFEFGPYNADRHPSDILPALPMFRHLFSPLSTDPSTMTLKASKVLVADVECVTSTIVKVRGPTWYLKVKKGEQDELILCAAIGPQALIRTYQRH